MRCIVARVLSAVTSLLAAGCGTQLDLSYHLVPDETPGVSGNQALASSDLSEGYTLAPASGRAASDHENGLRAETQRPRPGLKPQSFIQDLLPELSTKGPDIAPSTLVGLNFGETRRLLGPPDTQEDGQPSRIWQYADSDCQFRLHFYYDLKAQRYRLLHFEARPYSGAKVIAQAFNFASEHCLRAFRQRLAANDER